MELANDPKVFRLLIREWYGYAPQINALILYSPGKPPVPKAPEKDYVLIIGNQLNGATFTLRKSRTHHLMNHS